MTTLKPCPFCLTEGAKLIELWDTFDAGHVAHIHCEHCGADGPSVYGESGAEPTLMRARSMWNGRAVRYEPPQEPAPQPVAWMWQHCETGRTGFVEHHEYTGEWKRDNPRLRIVEPLYASAHQPVGEPVCWGWRVPDGRITAIFSERKDNPDVEVVALFAAPPQRRPLTDEQIDALLAHFGWRDVDIGEYTARKQVAFARAVERAIKEKP